MNTVQLKQSLLKKEDYTVLWYNTELIFKNHFLFLGILTFAFV